MPIRHELLVDLDPEDYLFGVKKFCMTQKEIYPGTNIIALIRMHALDNKNRRREMEEGRVLKEKFKPFTDEEHEKNIIAMREAKANATFLDARQ